VKLHLAIFAIAFSAVSALAQNLISFPTEDGAIISANLYGSSPRALLLVHGGRFTKESWAPQVPQFLSAGYEVLAIDLRNFGHSRGPGGPEPSDAQLATDVLTAVRYLHTHGAKSVSIVGGSMGGSAAGDASINSRSGEIDRIVMLGAAPNLPADKLKSPALFLVARDDTSGDGPRLPGIRAQYEKTPQPKKLIILDGSAHAQFLFQTDQADRVMREILSWLNGNPVSEKSP
jgi:pimeloyl-ACP methyl ester carboxylesterase